MPSSAQADIVPHALSTMPSNLATVPAPLIRIRKAERGDLDALMKLEHRVFATDRFQTYVQTSMRKRGISAEAALAERVAAVPARRIGDPDEFGAACAFLCSAQAGYITGQNLLIDGGAFPGAF